MPKKPTPAEVAQAEAFERDKRRVARQEQAFLAGGPVFKEALLQRAYDLMWENRAEEGDVIMEFLPKADVLALFEILDNDENAKPPQPRSRFYEPKD